MLKTLQRAICFALTVLITTTGYSRADSLPAIPAPDVNAKAWLLIDFHSGRSLAEYNADQQLAPASLTKLMTIYIVLDRIKRNKLSLDDVVDITEEAWRVNGSRMFVRPGTLVPVGQLLRGLIIHSANDAAVALAIHIYGNEKAFVSLMNETAKRLGLTNTYFKNVTGLDQSGHYSSARDLSILARSIIRDFPKLYRLFAEKRFKYKEITHYNRNALLWRLLNTPGGTATPVDGLKTGHTQRAGYSIVASSAFEHMRLIAVVLNTKNESTRTFEAGKLLQFGFNAYETRLLYRSDTPATYVKVWMGNINKLPLGLGTDLYMTLPRGTFKYLNAKLTVKNILYAPVQRNQKVGKLVLVFKNKQIAEYPLLAIKQIKEGNIIQRTLDRIQLKFK